MNQTVLVNLETHTGEYTKITRRTRFGNPYRLIKDGGNYTREESVSEYISHLSEKVSKEDFGEDIETLRGDVIGCWCVPKLCHGHVILYYLDTGTVPNDINELLNWGAPERNSVGKQTGITDY